MYKRCSKGRTIGGEGKGGKREEVHWYSNAVSPQVI